MPELVLTIEENIHTCTEKMLKKHGLQCLTLKGHFTYKYKTFERIQFPLRQQPEKTIHKSQGDTLHEVVILDLNQEAIAVADCVRQELHRLRTDATLQLCFKPLYNLSSNYFKVVFNNSRSLHAHFNDLKSDPNILDADVIGIAESRLISTDENDDFHVPGFETPVRLDQSKQTLIQDHLMDWYYIIEMIVFFTIQSLSQLHL
ncbi:Hypothetical predicted protein [Mytilus galloprovincialis]|uniref:Uncharacterized protein n=1 Tax=Mytilus galloprovincialis TaxID=29158 RepID=A0A8B6HFW0_MYTGA|nr:Hypothetical predicted protein [Mytilus galloprovincialis]